MKFKDLLHIFDTLALGKGEKLPTVCIFGALGLELSTPAREESEEKRLDCRCYSSDAKVEQVLVRDQPQVLITLGRRSSFPNLANAPFEIRRRWLHYDTPPDLPRLGIEAYNCYLRNLLDKPEPGEDPLVTVFTPAFKTGEKILRPFHSLREQTYSNWEWIIVDDSDDGGETFGLLRKLAKKDHRIQVFKPGEHSGRIGQLKKWACSLGRGRFLVELDHDDALTDYALDCVVKGFQRFPEAGFLYTDCAEIFEDGTNLTYRPGWAFGFGSYTDVEYRGRLYKSGSGGNINAKTIRHIISSPNHLRAWKKSFYDSIEGHNAGLHVADDYELVVRSFLKTRIIRVPRLCYLQYAGDSAQARRNGDIHRHVGSIRIHYDKMIHDRLIELGCEDFVWDEEKGRSDLGLPNPQEESRANWIAKV